MRKIDKFLAKLDGDIRRKIFETLEKIKAGNFSNLNLKKLQGSADAYRVRVGRIRIKFFMNANDIKINEIDFRSDTTYR
jgi:mRNA-degrading endonuclease RelE of RelBE toxin-antitoxin system